MLTTLPMTAGDTAKDEQKGCSPPSWSFGRSGSAGKLPPVAAAAASTEGQSPPLPGGGGGEGMKRSRSYLDMLNDKLKEEPSTVRACVPAFCVLCNVIIASGTPGSNPPHFQHKRTRTRAWCRCTSSSS